MKHKLITLALVVLLALPVVVASQTTRLTPTKALTSDISTDGYATFNTTSGGVFQVNNSPLSFGHWGDSKLGNLTNATLSAYRTWTLPDLTGTLATLEGTNTWTSGQTFSVGPTFSDYTNANHDHLDTDDGGTLSANAIASGTISRTRLPSELAYEDEANTFAVRVILSDGTTANGYLYIPLQSALVVNGSSTFQGNTFFNDVTRFNRTTTHASTLYVANPHLMQANGTFVAKTNSYHEGPLQANVTVDIFGPGFTGQITGLSHGMTNKAPTDVYSELIRYSPTTGGAYFWGATTDSANSAFFVDAASASAAPGASVVRFEAGKKNGITTQQLASTEQAFSFTSGANALLTVYGTGRAIVAGEAQINGNLNHDGSSVGFYGVAPIAQRTGPLSITDSTTGTPGLCSEIVAGALYSQTDMQRVRGCLATLIERLNDLIADVDAVGLTS